MGDGESLAEAYKKSVLAVYRLERWLKYLVDEHRSLPGDEDGNRWFRDICYDALQRAIDGKYRSDD